VGEENADKGPGYEKLDGRRHTPAPVPATQPMAWEKLAATRPRQAQEVFDVRSRGRECTCDGGVEWAPESGEQNDCGDPRSDLELAIEDVFMWHQIAG
jgi:hypothetical protein